jgi:AcrR family transcriptional regulator
MNQHSSSARPLPVTSRGHRTRERLLRAAESVFGDKGYDQASIADIVGRAEVGLGTFYVYFPDKKSAFVELVDERGARLRRVLAEAVAGLTDRLEIERAGLAAFVAFIAEHPKLYRIVRQAEFVDEEAFRRYYVELAKRYAAGLERAMQAGQIRRLDPEVLAYALMGLADFLGMRWVLWSDDPAKRAAVLEDALSFIHHGLAVSNGGGRAAAKSEAAKPVEAAPAPSASRRGRKA